MHILQERLIVSIYTIIHAQGSSFCGFMIINIPA